MASNESGLTFYNEFNNSQSEKTVRKSGFLSNVNIRVKLILSFALVVLVPIILIGLISINDGTKSLEDATKSQLSAIMAIKKAQILSYFDERKGDIQVLGTIPIIQQAIMELDDVSKEAKSKGYMGKRLLDYAPFKKSFDKYYGFVKGIMDAYGYYDIFLFSPNSGRIVLSGALENDFGTEMQTERTHLADTWKTVKNTLTNQFTDFEPYAPSNGTPAMFVIEPIIKDGKYVGSIGIQVSIEEIGEIMQERTGLGETGETYLIGSDKRMRSDSFLDPDGHSVKASFAGTVDKNGVDTEAAREALAGKTDIRLVLDYNGNWVYSAFSPLEFYGLKWAILADIDLHEVDQPVDAMTNDILLYGILIAIGALVLGLLIASTINKSIKNVIHQFGSLITATTQGRLDVRGDADNVDIDFKELIYQTNNLIDAFVAPINVTAEYIDRISKGDMPPKITDDYYGDFNEIKNNLNGCIDALQGLIDDMNHMSVEHDKGDIDIKIPVENYQNAFRQMADGINQMVFGHIAVKKKAMACIAEFGKGNFDAELEKFPGKKAFINDTIEGVRSNLKNFASQISVLIDATTKGELSQRGDSDIFEGGWAKLVGDVNNLIDAFVGPINVTAEYIDRISKGDMPPKITDNYYGDFNEIKNNLNSSIDAISAMVKDARNISEMASQGRLRVRADASAHMGDFNKIINGFNKALDAVTGLLDSIPTPIMGITKDFEIVYMNELGASLDNKTGSQLDGTKCFNHFKTSHCNTSNCACYQTIQQDRNITEETDAHPGVHDLEIKYTGTPIKNDAGQVIGAFEIVIDQTEIVNQMRKAEKVAEFQKVESDKLISNLEKMAEGDFTAQYQVGNYDENTKEAHVVFKEIESNLNNTMKEISNVLSNMKTYAETLASSSEELYTISNQLVDNSESMSEQSNNVAGASEQISTNINTMASTAEEMSVNINSVSSTSEQMSSNVNTVASAIEEMTTSINSIGNNAKDASSVAGQAMKLGDNATGTMNVLGDAAKEIGKVTEVIKRIAEQTNLLALNATIEAASAGEAGKGFAVVANEIKELANQSAQAAEDIATKIEGVQNNTNDAVKVISDVSEIISKINEGIMTITVAVDQQTKTTNEIASNVNQAASGVNNISSSIGEIAVGANDLSKNAGEIAKGINDVSSNIHSVSKSANESNSASQQVNISAKDVAKISNDLRVLVDKFKLN